MHLKGYLNYRVWRYDRQRHHPANSHGITIRNLPVICIHLVVGEYAERRMGRPG